jgi:nucleoid-associated protein YgaU
VNSNDDRDLTRSPAGTLDPDLHGVTLVPAGPTYSTDASTESPKEPESEVDSEKLSPIEEGKIVIYRVKSGDTLMKISFETYANVYRWREIYRLNKGRIQNPMALVKGMELKIRAPKRAVVISRNGKSYLIEKGATLSKISRQVYGDMALWPKIWENNRQLIRDPNLIYAGFSLYYLPPEKLQAKAPRKPASQRTKANLPEKVSTQ